LIDNLEYLKIFEVEKPISIGELWKTIFRRLILFTPSLKKWEQPQLETIFNQGSLSERILKALDNDFSEDNIKRVYRQLSGCLAQNRMFIL
jgi:carboxylate-amine ligase